MKTKFLLALLMVFSMKGFSQKDKQPAAAKPEISSARSMIENAETTRINKDWSQIAEFRSGIGETVKFFPVQIVNLKNDQKTNALQVDMQVKTKGLNGVLAGANAAIAGNTTAAAASLMNDGIISSWVDLNEVDEFITFIEQNVVPNLDLKYKDKSSEFIFNATELSFKYLVDEKRRRLSIELNSAINGGIPYYFWTEARVDKIPDLLPMLKKIKNKELEF